MALTLARGIGPGVTANGVIAARSASDAAGSNPVPARRLGEFTVAQGPAARPPGHWAQGGPRDIHEPLNRADGAFRRWIAAGPSVPRDDGFKEIQRFCGPKSSGIRA